MAASNETLNALHEATAAFLLDCITNGVPFKWDDDGNVSVIRKATAAEVGAAVAFLKNNNISATLEDSDALAALDKAMKAARAKSRPILDDLLNDDGYVN